MMAIDQNFVNTLNDPELRGIINTYITSREAKIKPCNCGGTTGKRCIGILRTCIETPAPTGGVYTKLDETGWLDFRVKLPQILGEFYSNYYIILNKIMDKKRFIENPPDPTDPNLEAQIQEKENDIEKMSLVLNEISFYINQIEIDLI